MVQLNVKFLPKDTREIGKEKIKSYTPFNHTHYEQDAMTSSFPHLTAVSGVVGSSPALATCETSHVLLAGVPGGFSRGSTVFAPPTDCRGGFLEGRLKLIKGGGVRFIHFTRFYLNFPMK